MKEKIITTEKIENSIYSELLINGGKTNVKVLVFSKEKLDNVNKIIKK